MRRLVGVIAVAVAVLGWTAAAQAQCTTHTYFIGGVIHICTTCCTGSFCNTSCT